MTISEREFWATSLKEFDALVKQWEQTEDRKFFRSGIIAATLANINRDPHRTAPFSPHDFMPQRGGAQELSAAEAAQNAGAFFKSLDKTNKQKQKRKRG